MDLTGKNIPSITLGMAFLPGNKIVIHEASLRYRMWSLWGTKANDMLK
jgi:hypothetical protein